MNYTTRVSKAYLMSLTAVELAEVEAKINAAHRDGNASLCVDPNGFIPYVVVANGDGGIRYDLDVLNDSEVVERFRTKS